MIKSEIALKREEGFYLSPVQIVEFFQNGVESLILHDVKVNDSHESIALYSHSDYEILAISENFLKVIEWDSLERELWEILRGKIPRRDVEVVNLDIIIQRA